MKNKLLLLGIIIFGGANANAQSGCLVVRDSVPDGHDSLRYTDYTYNTAHQIIKGLEYSIVYGQNTKYDTLFYNGAGENTKVESYVFDGASWMLEKTIVKTYANGKVTKIEASGNNGSPWTMDHDLIYDVNGDLTGIMLDESSVTGSPGGMVGSFANVVRNGGNFSSVDLIVDFGAGPDTIELVAAFDTKNSVERILYAVEAPDYLIGGTTNNLLSLTLVNNEMIGNAGQMALDWEYTYNSNDDVLTFHASPAIFDEYDSYVNYSYDCGYVGINEASNDAFTFVYPNPTSDDLNIVTADENSQVQIMDLNGKIMMNQNLDITTSKVNVSSLEQGIYFVVVKSKNSSFSMKFIKQ